MSFTLVPAAGLIYLLSIAEREKYGMGRKDNLAKYKIPVAYHFIESIPRTPVGKTNKDELRKML